MKWPRWQERIYSWTHCLSRVVSSLQMFKLPVKWSWAHVWHHSLRRPIGHLLTSWPQRAIVILGKVIDSFSLKKRYLFLMNLSFQSTAPQPAPWIYSVPDSQSWNLTQQKHQAIGILHSRRSIRVGPRSIGSIDHITPVSTQISWSDKILTWSAECEAPGSEATFQRERHASFGTLSPIESLYKSLDLKGESRNGSTFNDSSAPLEDFVLFILIIPTLVRLESLFIKDNASCHGVQQESFALQYIANTGTLWTFYAHGWAGKKGVFFLVGLVDLIQQNEINVAFICKLWMLERVWRKENRIHCW